MSSIHTLFKFTVTQIEPTPDSNHSISSFTAREVVND